MSLRSRKPVQSRGLLLVLYKSAGPELVVPCEAGLRVRVSLGRCELIEPQRFFFVFREAATAIRIKRAETIQSGCKSLVCGELEETRGVLIIFWESTSSLFVENAEVKLRWCISLVGRQPQGCSILST